MNRTILVIIIIVLFLGLLGVAVALFWKPLLLNNANQPARNTNTAGNLNTPATTNTAGNRNAATSAQSLLNVQAQTLDSKEVKQRVEYRGADIPINRVEIANGVTLAKIAPEGKKYVVIYFEREIFKHEVPLFQWIGTEIQLLDSQNRTYVYDLAQFVLEDQLKTQEHFLAFLVEGNAEGFTLRFVRPEEDVKVDLGL